MIARTTFYPLQESHVIVEGTAQITTLYLSTVVVSSYRCKHNKPEKLMPVSPHKITYPFYSVSDIVILSQLF